MSIICFSICSILKSVYIFSNQISRTALLLGTWADLGLWKWGGVDTSSIAEVVTAQLPDPDRQMLQSSFQGHFWFTKEHKTPALSPAPLIPPPLQFRHLLSLVFSSPPLLQQSLPRVAWVQEPTCCHHCPQLIKGKRNTRAAPAGVSGLARDSRSGQVLPSRRSWSLPNPPHVLSGWQQMLEWELPPSLAEPSNLCSCFWLVEHPAQLRNAVSVGSREPRTAATEPSTPCRYTMQSMAGMRQEWSWDFPQVSYSQQQWQPGLPFLTCFLLCPLGILCQPQALDTAGDLSSSGIRAASTCPTLWKWGCYHATTSLWICPNWVSVTRFASWIKD